MTHAQRVPYRGSKHYNLRMKQFEQEGVLPDNAIIMLGDESFLNTVETGTDTSLMQPMIFNHWDHRWW